MAEKQQWPCLKKIIADVGIVSAMIITVILLECCVSPVRRGFFCDDDSIRYPHLSSTISKTTLIATAIFLPSLVISINEFFIRPKKKCQTKSPLVLFRFTIPRWVWISYKQVGVFLFGILLDGILLDIAKVSVGRLRPHFVAVCQPDMEELCSQPERQHDYIQEYECHSEDSYSLRQMRLSFPSGHASISAFAMIYLAVYLQFRMWDVGSRLTKPFVQLILLSMTIYCSLSRVADYQHHATDVLGGFILGIAVVVFITCYISDFFSESQDEEECSSKCAENHEIITIESALGGGLRN